MKVALVQLDIVWEDKPANRGRVCELLDSAGVSPGTLVVLPEMFATGFTMNVEAAVAQPEEDEQFLRQLARRFGVAVVAGVAGGGEGGKGRNEAVAYSPEGTELVRYVKMHPFSLGKEDQHYPGGPSVTMFEWGGFQITPFVCYDLRFPEIFRIAVRQGAQLFVEIANWPEKRIDHWVTLLRARAIENLAWVIGVNRCGTDPYSNYPGRSLVVDPHGTVVLDAGANEGVYQTDLDLAELLSWRDYFPPLRDMRPDTLPA